VAEECGQRGPLLGTSEIGLDTGAAVDIRGPEWLYLFFLEGTVLVVTKPLGVEDKEGASKHKTGGGSVLGGRGMGQDLGFDSNGGNMVIGTPIFVVRPCSRGELAGMTL
jgi:hypothetical protein